MLGLEPTSSARADNILSVGQTDLKLVAAPSLVSWVLGLQLCALPFRKAPGDPISQMQKQVLRG